MVLQHDWDDIHNHIWCRTAFSIFLFCVVFCCVWVNFLSLHFSSVEFGVWPALFETNGTNRLHGRSACGSSCLWSSVRQVTFNIIQLTWWIQTALSYADPSLYKSTCLLDMDDAYSCSFPTCWWPCQEHALLSPPPSPFIACSGLAVVWLCLAWDSTPSHLVSYVVECTTMSVKANIKYCSVWLFAVNAVLQNMIPVQIHNKVVLIILNLQNLSSSVILSF